MMSADSIAKHKVAMLEALEKTLGVVTSAAKMVGIDRTTHYGWLKDDPEYAAAVLDTGDVALDYAETQLHKQIGEGQPASTIFYLKTKGKKRGYIERSEISGPDGGPIEGAVQIIQLPANERNVTRDMLNIDTAENSKINRGLDDGIQK